jgi:hypothetical protein
MKNLNSHLFWLNSHPFLARSIICGLNLSLSVPPPVNRTRKAIGDGLCDATRTHRRSQQQLRREQEGVILTIKSSERCEFNQKTWKFKYHQNLMRKLYTMLEGPSLCIAFTLIPLRKPREKVNILL